MALSKVGDENLYIGGYFALFNKLTLANANITHVLSVLRMGSNNNESFQSFKKHMHIPVDDVADEDLLQHFPAACTFIQEGLDAGEGVLVHCAMGKSRSATVCIAYLLHRQPTTLDPDKALELLRETRPICEPNDGFMEQLRLYHKMGCPDDVVTHPMYQRWLYQRVIEESVACGRGPELDEIRFEDDERVGNATAANEVRGGESGDVEVRCRKCRRQLATSPFIIPHTPQSQEKQIQKQRQKQTTQLPTTSCAHIFLHPLKWMRPSLFPPPEPDAGNTDVPESDPVPVPEPEPSSDSPLSGRLSCPNTSCGVNLGKFAWAGIPCSCGEWVVPAIALARARVDVVNAGMRKGGGAGPAIRMPPGMRQEDIGRDGGGGAGGGGKGVL